MHKQRLFRLVVFLTVALGFAIPDHIFGAEFAGVPADIVHFSAGPNSIAAYRQHERENDRLLRVAAANCGACGPQTKTCHFTCNTTIPRGPNRKMCHNTCRVQLQHCKAGCTQGVTRNNQQRKPAAKVDLEASVRPKASQANAAELAVELQGSFVSALPPSIDDVTQILESQKIADKDKAQELRRLADEKPPATRRADKLLVFYAKRGEAAGDIGRSEQQLADLNKALQYAKSVSVELYGDTLWDLAVAELDSGLPQQGFGHMTADLKLKMPHGKRLARTAVVASLRARKGQIRWAAKLMQKVEWLLAQSQNFNASVRAEKENIWLGRAKRSKADIAFVKGDYEAAESMTRDALYLVEKDLKRGVDEKLGPSVRDILRLQLSTILLRRGRLVEAETVVRKALNDVLARVGLYSTDTPRVLVQFASVLISQGRLQEAQKLLNASLAVMKTMSYPDASAKVLTARSKLASAKFFAGDTEGAMEIFQDVQRVASAGKDKIIKQAVRLNKDRLLVSALSGQHKEVASIIRERLQAAKQAHRKTSRMMHGILAIALMKSGDRKQAYLEFKASVPALLSGAQSNEDEEYTLGTASEYRAKHVAEAYLELLAEIHATPLEAELKINAAEEAFQIADAARGQLVQRAVASASARASVSDEKLAKLIREEQDARKRLSAQNGLLAGILSTPSNEQDPEEVKELRADIENLQQALDTATTQIRKAYPEYSTLLNPGAPTVDGIRSALRDDEAFISIYLAGDRSYVWALPKKGGLAFAVSKLSAERAGAYVQALREALAPRAATLGEIPDFDVRVAYSLYRQILKPVEAGWKSAASLLVSTNGALGQLPLTVLPTEKTRLSDTDSVLFEQYRHVKWLGLSHAVTLLPSAATFVTLRTVPKAAANRKPFIGFGDPVFNKAQETRVASADNNPAVLAARGVNLNTRGLPIRVRAAPRPAGAETVDIGKLPRLPDTAEEVRSLAIALHADPSSALHLGLDANEDEVLKQDLRDYKVIAFATHGLVPGDLTGLREPALALSAPSLAKSKGDGLLTMSEIMGLKLDADWVVLSACNTGSGRGAGAEAVSGLGRAFFYAGTRALLVSSWPVETTSARLLTTDIFERLTKEPDLTRAQALQQAIAAMIARPGKIDPETGKPLFYYAHPIFWAPFILVGDGGGA